MNVGEIYLTKLLYNIDVSINNCVRDSFVIFNRILPNYFRLE